MSDRKKAVKVAEDVIKRLRYLQLEEGVYLKGELDCSDADDLQAVVRQAEKQCHVCLLGACLLSKARLFNAVPLQPLRGSFFGTPILHAGYGDTVEALKEVFDGLTMRYMESAFEVSWMDGSEEEDYDEEVHNGAVWFGAQHLKLRRRVKAVMQEVIKQKGIWRPKPKLRSETDAAIDKLYAKLEGANA